MNQEKRKEILDKIVEISENVGMRLDSETQEIENISHYEDFEFKGDRYTAKRDVYIVEISNKETKQYGDKTEEIENTYEIYSKQGDLIATVSQGKIHFTQKFIESLRDTDKAYFKQLNIDNIDLELPEELKENDVVMNNEEIEEYSREMRENRQDGAKDTEKEKEDVGKETEEEKKENTAEALGIDTSDIKSVCTINPREKITDKHNLVDIMPETENYEEISIVWSNSNVNEHGQFTVLGVKNDGTREPINSISPVEGTSTSKEVISVNEDGTVVEEKQVKGLFRINSGNRNNGISVSIGDYGMMNVDYVSNIMDKENRRSTPIRTKDAQNQRITTAKVRENAGDSIKEAKEEGRNFRENQEDGVNTQSLDGIDIDKADGNSLTLEELKEQIKDKALEEGDMSREEMREFIQSELNKSGLELTNEENEETIEDIREDILDESRFPTKGNRV